MTVRAVLGIQGTQSRSNFARGISRYIEEHACALIALAPDRVAALDSDPLGPAPQLSAPLLGRLVAERADHATAGIYHVMSPFEEIPLGRIWPAWARDPDTLLLATLYDLIPLLHPERYLNVPQMRRRYLARLQLLRAADAVLAISQHTADDAAQHLGISRSRLFVISGGCSDCFRPAQTTWQERLARLRSRLPRLPSEFSLYVGGLDPRKNLDGLVRAYGRLDPALRRRYPLVIACSAADWERRHVEGLARAAGVPGEVVFTGYVEDEVLLLLYQSCRLLISPSLYEGFGLTVLEGIRSGAVVLASDISPHRELIPDADARFDPERPEQVAQVIERGLRDDSFRARRLDEGPRQTHRFTWKRVAELTLGAYDAASSARRTTVKMVSARG